MTIQFRIAEKNDAALLDQALRQLSVDLEDIHKASLSDLTQAGWGDIPAFRAILAETEDPEDTEDTILGKAVIGTALYSPLFSTTRGYAGIYVSDLWVSKDFRGQEMGKKLLREALNDGIKIWDAKFIKLNVYETSPAARRFYERLGFNEINGQSEMLLNKADIALRDE